MAINEFTVPDDMPERWEEIAAQRTGDFDEDIRLGGIYALVAMQRAKMQDSAAYLAEVMTDLIRSGEFGALEAAFITKIAQSARAGNMH